MIVGVDQIDPGDAQRFAQLRAVRPELKIIVYGLDDDRAADWSVRAGADAFVRKSAPVEDLLVALRQMTSHPAWWDALLWGKGAERRSR